MSNTSRVINNKPNKRVSPEDILSTNVYIPSFRETKELTNVEKTNFREYIERDRKTNKVKTALQATKKRNDYDYFASVSASKQNNSTIIEKEKKNVIKIESPSIIDIDTRNRDKNAYPYPSDFKFPLGKTFYNIKSIELVSTAIPNTDQVITNTPEKILNNKISWVNREDQDLGIYLNRSVSSIGDFLFVTIQNHRLGTQVRDGRFYVKISKSTTTPSVDGIRFAEIFDANTLKIPFNGGINATATLDIDTGVPNYTVDLTPGNYTATSIATEIQKQMNLVKRRNNTGDIFHYFTVDVNLDTDVMVFRSYITRQLQGNPLTVISGSGIITVTSISHGHKSGDFVLIIGAKTTGGITSNILNGLFTVDVLNSDSFTYEVNERASETANGGGTTCKTGTPSEFKLIFDTAESLIANNIGFPSEDSSEKLGTSQSPLTTKALHITDAQISGDYVTFTSPGHELESVESYVLTSLTAGSTPIFTTSTNHGLRDTQSVHIYYPWSEPKLNGFYSITATGPDTFRLDTITISVPGSGLGELKHGGDTIKLIDFKSIPSINGNLYFVENGTANTFQIKQTLTQIQQDNIPNTLVGTTQIFINHENHGFNTIVSIDPDTATSALITTKVPHGLNGERFTGATKQSSILNTVDITTLSPHGLETSDTVFISNSVSGADISGTHVIQFITSTIFRIFFVGGTDLGTCDVNTGDNVIFSETNSTPSLSSNNLGIIKFYIEYVNDTSFIVRTGFPITTPGTFGLLGRDNKIALHRVTASENGGSTLGGIPLISINGHFLNIDRIVDENNYMVRVKEHSTFTSSAGGSDTVITSSRHGYRKFQSNTFSGEEEGALYRSISLEGENYLYLVSPGLQTVFSPGNEIVGEIFSRIVLTEPPGSMLFDSFVSVPKIFNPPLSSLKDISFKMKRSDGILFNFNDIDYSMSLKIIEIVDRIVDTEMSSVTGASDLH